MFVLFILERARNSARRTRPNRRLVLLWNDRSQAQEAEHQHQEADCCRASVPEARREARPSGLEYRLRRERIAWSLFGRDDRTRASGLFIGAGGSHAGIKDRPGAMAATTPLGVLFLKGVRHGI